MIGGYSSIVACFVSNGSGNSDCSTIIKKNRSVFSNCVTKVESFQIVFYYSGNHDKYSLFYNMILLYIIQYHTYLADCYFICKKT